MLWLEKNVRSIQKSSHLLPLAVNQNFQIVLLNIGHCLSLPGRSPYSRIVPLSRISHHIHNRSCLNKQSALLANGECGKSARELRPIEKKGSPLKRLITHSYECNRSLQFETLKLFESQSIALENRILPAVSSCGNAVKRTNERKMIYMSATSIRSLFAHNLHIDNNHGNLH